MQKDYDYVIQKFKILKELLEDIPEIEECDDLDDIHHVLKELYDLAFVLKVEGDIICNKIVDIKSSSFTQHNEN